MVSSAAARNEEMTPILRRIRFNVLSGLTKAPFLARSNLKIDSEASGVTLASWWERSQEAESNDA